MATRSAVGVSRRPFANGVIKKTKGDANIPKRQTEIHPMVYLKLSNRFFDNLATCIAKPRATNAISIANTARSDTTQRY